MKYKIINYLSPIARLGIRKYSFFFPLGLTIFTAGLIEAYDHFITKNLTNGSFLTIFVFIVLIIYFAFRDGRKGGLIAVATTIAYYFYIVISRNYTGWALIEGLEAIALFSAVYLFLALIVGWLKETIDELIENETEARRGAEEGKLRLQTILDQLPVGVLMADAKHHTLEGNKHLYKILDRPSISYLETIMNFESDSASNAGKPMTAKEWPIIRALIKGETVPPEEIEYKTKNDRVVQLRVNAAPIKNKKREVIAAVSTVYDITYEKDLETRKDDFVNMASHELKTPLTSMKLYVELLLSRMKKNNDPGLVKVIQNIKNQTDRLQELVNDLLDVSRIQTGKLHFQRENFEIADLIQETIDVLQESTNKQKLVFLGQEKISVYADKFRVYQVLTNLITNAIKYSSEGTVIIIKVSKKGTKAIISVQDFGIGIAKVQQKKIFERLYQVTDRHEKTFPGLGLGLYISKVIINRHRGRIWVEGEKGKGSTFYFTLPLVRN